MPTCDRLYFHSIGCHLYGSLFFFYEAAAIVEALKLLFYLYYQKADEGVANNISTTK